MLINSGVTAYMDVAASRTLTLNNSIVGPGALACVNDGTLILAGSNSYTGGTTINAGVLKIATNFSIAGNVTINSGGTFDLNGQALSALSSVSIAGSGAVGQASALINSSTANARLNNGLTLTGDAMIGVVTNRIDLYGALINGNGYTLTISNTAVGGNNLLDIRDNNSLTNFASINVVGGLLRLESSQSWTGLINVASGATLDSYGIKTQAVAVALNNGTLSNPSGTQQWNGAISLANAGTFSAVAIMIVNGNITDVGSLAKTGTGLLTLNGTNTFSGGISLQAGTLLFGSTSAIPASVTSLFIPSATAAGVTYQLDQNFLSLISNASMGAVGLGASSTNALDFTSLPNVSLGAINGTWTNSGTITPANNTYRLGGGGGTLVLTNVNALTDDVSTRSLVIGGGAGTVRLAASNSYTGITTINTGTLVVADNNALGGTNGGTVVNSGATLQLANGVTVSGESLTLSTVSGVQPTLSGPSSGAATWAGNITLTGNQTAIFSNGGGQFTNSGNVSSSTLINLWLWGAGTGTLSGVINLGSAGITIDSLGTWNLNTTGTWGSTTLKNTKNFVMGATNALPTATIVTFGGGGVGGTLTLNGFSQTIGGLVSGIATGNVVNASATLSTLTISNSSGASAVVGGTRGGTNADDNNFALTKLGTGVQTLTGTNTLTGDTTINGGTLSITAANSFSNSAITVNAGALLLGATNVLGAQALTLGAA
ncbi:MAG: autotransporter-associated beta strand repeat-containing protein, partial [Kiritimatiellaeota bacterium]|nr:autotransporter-associated beta strand repeat-containing protein [Kiritimatiellota bacterium]